MTDNCIDQMRKNYTFGGLHKKDVDDDPIAQFKAWFAEAIGGQANDSSQTDREESGIPPWLEPNAMTLSTATPNGAVSSRIVLLKGIENGCFVFYSNYESDKGRDIANNPNVSLAFYWPHLQRQVLVAGTASRIDRDRSRQYFHSRPRASQLGALSSVQSSMIASREVLEKQFAELEKQYPEGTEIPLPENWGGYEVAARRIEFWQGRTSRLHDRIVYLRDEAAWAIQRLSP